MDSNWDFRKTLREVTTKILNETSPGQLLYLTDKLFDLLVEICRSRVDLDPKSQDSILASGKALNPYWAAICIKDFKRTQCFMNGLYQAVADQRALYPGECIHVVYIGTGPFATIALPVLLAYCSNEVKFTFLDVHEEAIASLAHLLDVLGMQDHVHELVCADATTYRLPEGQRTHIVLTETMQRAFAREPQVAITLHLAPQMAEDTVWIPESVVIEAALMNKQKDTARMMGQLPEGESSFQIIGEVMNLTKATVVVPCDDLTQHPLLQGVSLPLPPDMVSEYPHLVLMTTIQVYGDHRLLPWDTSITLPFDIRDLRESGAVLKDVVFEYRMGREPGFRLAPLDV